MPFTNIWSLPGVTTTSERRGVRRVAGALRRAGGLVFGWDIHWGLSWSRDLRREVRHVTIETRDTGAAQVRHVTGVRGMLKQLRRDTGQLRGKIIFLSHDYNHLHPEVEKIFLGKVI